MKKSALLPYFFVVLLTTSCAQNSDRGINLPEKELFTLEPVVNGVQNPWGMAFLPDGALLLTEKSGKLLLFQSEELTEIEGLPRVYVRGQGGLMDIELHPDYNENGWLYLSYSSTEGGGTGGTTEETRNIL